MCAMKTLLALSILSLALPAQQSGPTPASGLLPPERITAAGAPIDVTVGHAAPYVMDFDGDGVRDLLVGEFGDGEFPAARLPMQKGSFVHGRLRIYKNHGSDHKPRFERFEYLMAGGVPASIPST